MDISTIGFIKNHELIQSGTDENRKARLKQLEELRDVGCKFSFGLAMLEKAMDRKHVIEVNDLIQRFIDDYEQVIIFFDSENSITESPVVIEELLTTLMDKNVPRDDWGELAIPKYIEFLNYANEKELYNKKSPSKRFDLAVELSEKAGEIGILNPHIIRSLCTSVIYGNVNASKVFKFQKNTSEFNASNAIGDILTFSRMAELRSLFNNQDAQRHIYYRTEDKYLELLHSTLIVNQTSKIDGEDGKISSYKLTVLDESSLFPDLYSNGYCNDINERQRLYELLNLELEPKNVC